MSGDSNNYRGVFTVLSVPYTDDFAIDTAVLETEIDFAIDHGIHGLVIAMASEIFRLADAERDALVAATVQAAAGRVPVISSVGAESFVQVQRHAEAASDAGTTGVIAIPPTLVECDADALRRYYELLLEVVDGPVFIQDASGYLGNSIPLQLQIDLYLEHPDRIKFKPEAQPAGETISKLYDGTGGAPIFEGMGGLTLIDNYHRGICGTMPGADMLWAIMPLWQALEKGDVDTAQRIQGPLSTLVAMLHNIDAFIFVEKLFLHEQGIFPNTLARLPAGYTPDEQSLREFMRLFNVLKDTCGVA
ncbi:MAG: dihydrodipicolinate synthase family protein [Lentisphaeria bacterium]|jgi:4-hydroxy-tetrahydrodipicolinate synthase|nr:dihydrodipicolinate synthase family protein [Lentisphaeria bacterium]